MFMLLCKLYVLHDNEKSLLNYLLYIVVMFFFQSKAESSDIASEKAQLYQLAYDWFGQFEGGTTQREQVYISLWINTIKAHIIKEKV